MTQPTTEELRTLIEKAAKLMGRLFWRIRFAIYGYKKTSLPIGFGIYYRLVPLRIWWGWSDSSADLFGLDTHPHDAADEEIWAMQQ